MQGAETHSSEPAVDVAARRLRHWKRLVDAWLASYLADEERASLVVAAEAGLLIGDLRRFVLGGGKRLRAALVYAGYLACAPLTSVMEVALTPGAGAVELLHAFLLVHDDIIDRDDFRHGVPTVHASLRSWFAEHYAEEASERYGRSLGLLTGDIAAMLAVEVLSQLPFAPALVLHALRVMTRVAVSTGFGEALDVLAERQPEVSTERALLIHEYKTAKYSIEGPLHIGAVLAGASDEQLAGLSRFALPFGVAYQLQDDLLGVFGDEVLTGKAVGADLREGKRTPLVTMTLERAEGSVLRELLGDSHLSPEGITRARQLLRDSGALAECQRIIRSSIDQAAGALGGTTLRQEGQEFLRGFLVAMTVRSA
ncbi:MAG: polyprenyl synthetase family protein [Chloroflexi bacterium]|nr:polyprenyl synthetase family protein [Chloroflexota bacterium]